MSPADGTVIYVGRIEDGLVKEVKGITYSLDEFLGPGVCDSEELEFIDRVKHKNGAENFRVQPSRAKFFSNMDEDLELPAMKSCPRKGNELFCVVMYLSPGDYHHFHSPAEWTATLQRHFSGIFYYLMLFWVNLLNFVHSWRVWFLCARITPFCLHLSL